MIGSQSSELESFGRDYSVTEIIAANIVVPGGSILINIKLVGKSWKLIRFCIVEYLRLVRFNFHLLTGLGRAKDKRCCFWRVSAEDAKAARFCRLV